MAPLFAKAPAAAISYPQRIVGDVRSGGYEWSASPDAAPMRRGHTCVELDAAGKISRLTVVYDSSLLNYTAYQSLVGLAAEAAA
ncbi:hypothetical protein [Nocardia alni]|uniref:hypothetical protein n=1 Tax=Nocardia alni TaxID=2815723 RepID=UPI001C228E31|nr:hypothetical protein [Nocardia alni]